MASGDREDLQADDNVYATERAALRTDRNGSMTYTPSLSIGFLRPFRELTAILCIGLLLPGVIGTASAQTPAAAAPDEQASAKLPADQLDSLVAPIALYPDPLLSQALVASTYPLEVIQLQQWLAKNKGLDEKALAAAVAKQDWDPSIQGLAALPDVVKQLGDNIKWTTDLGNAFLAQQKDVMEAVQRMRKKAQDNGNLKSSEQQKVEVKTVESQPVIVIEQANPQVVYVPSYNPTVVYGAPDLSVPSDLLPAAGILRGRHGHLVRRGRRDGCDVGRRLGLWLRMGRQQQRLHQPQQHVREQR